MRNCFWPRAAKGLTIDEINPIWLKTPAAPFAAALVEQVDIDIPRILEAMVDLERRFDCVLVEGVGGWLVPIRADYFVSDLAAEMKLPVLVVAQNRLGCLNHSMLTIRSVRESRPEVRRLGAEQSCCGSGRRCLDQ